MALKCRTYQTGTLSSREVNFISSTGDILFRNNFQYTRRNCSLLSYNSIYTSLLRIWGSHSSGYENFYLVGYNTV
jgi:hypothetical protein